MNFPGYPMFYPVSGHSSFPPTTHSDDAGKIFVGGIPAETTKEVLTEYFSQYGEVEDCIIMLDNVTGRSRGFGFVTFVDHSTVSKVVGISKHVIQGKTVDAKQAVPKGPNQSNILRSMGITSNRADRNPECKIFVGGVAQGTTESDLEIYFKEYGKVLEVKIPKDQNTQRARGFSFVLFDNPDSVINATKENFHRINGKTVEVKKVQLQPHKGGNQYDNGSEDGRIRSPPPPYLLTGYPRYPTYPQIGPQAFYSESMYDPSRSGSASSPASSSVSSSGYGNQSSTRHQMNNYLEYLPQIYDGLSELSISQQYQRARGMHPLPRPQQYPVPPNDTINPAYNTQSNVPSGPSPTVPFHNDVPYGSSPVPHMFTQMSGQVPPAQYIPSSTPQASGSMSIPYNR